MPFLGEEETNLERTVYLSKFMKLNSIVSSYYHPAIVQHSVNLDAGLPLLELKQEDMKI